MKDSKVFFDKHPVRRDLQEKKDKLDVLDYEERFKLFDELKVNLQFNYCDVKSESFFKLELRIRIAGSCLEF